MPEVTIETFLKAATEERLKIAREDHNAEMLKAHMGQDAYNEYQKIAGKMDQLHLSIRAPKNLIFVPGVMGSLLQSKTKGGIWWIDVQTRNHIDELGLAPNGTQDADPDNQIAPVTTDPTYEPFLTAVLAQDDFGHEVFPYDWRKPLSLSTGALRDMVFRLYAENGNREVHLVAHSMGGLMVRAALMDHGKELWPKVGRIVFIGTPHYGSPAIAGYLKNHLWGFDVMTVLGLYLSRDTFRTLWGVLGMLPAPRGVYPGTRTNNHTPWNSGDPEDPYLHPCSNFDMYDAKAWDLGLTKSQVRHLQEVLNGAASFHQKMYDAHQALDQSLRDRMLLIAGVGFKTLFRLAYEKRLLGVWEHTKKITDRIANDPHREGDGRVPLASAVLEDLHIRHIRYIKGVHASLTNIPSVYEEVFRYLRGKNLQLPDSVNGALSGHLAPGEGESEAPNLDGSARVTPFSDDPGLWHLDPPDPIRINALRANLEAERLPEFTRARLL